MVGDLEMSLRPHTSSSTKNAHYRNRKSMTGVFNFKENLGDRK